MACLRYILIMNLLMLIVKSDRANLPKVHEDFNEEETVSENVRVTRHPKIHIHKPPVFDYKKMNQQDPQRIRYAQQQQVDTYLMAYQQQQHQKEVENTKSENYQTTRQINFDHYPIEATTDHHLKKVVDPKQLRIDNSQVSTVVQEKAPNKQKLEYRVNEDLYDTEPSSSRKRETKLLYSDSQLLKVLQDSTTLSPNYLATPEYIFANPQLAIDPKMLMAGLSYALPENHQLSQAGFKPATKSDIEALSSLLGKSPTIQLQGLNEILQQQQGYAVSAIPIPETKAQIAPQPIVKDHTPITEDVVDIPKPPKPTLQTLSTSPSSAYAAVKQKLQSDVKSIFGEHDDNLQYAAQYAFGYKIRDYHSGSNFGHEEMRNGKMAKGHYHVLLPDGRYQNVDYWADPSGYHAKVTYSSVAHH